MSIDGLPQGQRSKVYTRLIELLKADPTLSSVVKTWDLWGGEPFRQTIIESPPSIEILPRIGPMRWDSPDSQVGMLILDVAIYTVGHELTDALDLWEAVELAVYPPDRTVQLQVQNQLRSCKFRCTTGLVEFSQPATFRDERNDIVGCNGTLQVEIRRLINP